jgi:hypothetical protein
LEGRFNLRTNDRVGIIALPGMPSTEEFQRHTIPYEEVIRTSSVEQLQRWFAQKVVIIADLRPSAKDIVTCGKDERSVFGGWVNAAAIDAVLSDVAIRLPRWLDERFLASAGAASGCFLGLLIPIGFTRRGLGWAACTLVCVIVAISAYRSYHYLFNPLFPAMAAWIGIEGTAGIQRLCAGGPKPL